MFSLDVFPADNEITDRVFTHRYEGSDAKTLYDVMQSIQSQQLQYLRTERSHYSKFFFFWAWLPFDAVSRSDRWRMFSSLYTDHGQAAVA